MHMKSTNILFAALLALPVFAEGQTSTSRYPTTPPVVSKVVVESTYYFARRDYQPPVPVPNVGTTTSFDTPEGAAIASISAMKARDFDRFRSMWDEPSRKMMEAKDLELGQTPETWTEAWERVLTNRTAELVSRIDSGDYTIIAYRLVSPDSTVKPIEMQAVLKAKGKRWFLTQDMSADPVFSGWRKPEERVQRVGRQLATDDVAQ
jgi:hypothetical protein